VIHDIARHEGVITVENFFSAETLAGIRQGDYMVENFTDERDAGITARQKWEIESFTVFSELMDFIRCKAVRHYCEDYEDLSWRLVYNDEIKTCEIAISQYEPGAGFAWHVDHIMSNRRRVLNWIMTLEGEANLEFCKEPLDPNEVFQPEGWVSLLSLTPNKLVVMPSWYPHQVLATNESSRVAIHGHFGI
jgi:hypothetical protein